VVVIGVTLSEVAEPARCFFYGDSNDDMFITLLRDAMPGVRALGPADAGTNGAGDPYEPPRHGGGNHFAFVDGHVQWLPFPGGRYVDGGPWVVPDMSMYSRTGRWETTPPP
jgi:prepilin-type processing-associated H-X9-DG protein